jgi:HD superfamily phosphohydrolase
MPTWGLTKDQRDSRPWGIDPDLLKPDKTVTDPVHGDIYLTVLERMVVDSKAMQRLRRVRQLGTTHLVYPAATHSRFSHALGTMRAAQDLLDAVSDNRTGPRHTPDLLDEWSDDGVIPGTEVAAIDGRMAEATVLARLGGLMHDLCHVPLGHTIEDDLKVLEPHDENAPRLDKLIWPKLGDEVTSVLDAGKSLFAGARFGLKDELRMLILSKEKGRKATTDSSYPFVADIVGNTICADLIDYLRRDHAFTGLPIALGRRFVNDFYVMQRDHKHFSQRMVVRITRSAHQRADIVTELVKYLRYRYELTERVLNHHAKIAADAMIGKLLEMWSDATFIEVAAKDHPQVVADTGRENIDQLKEAIFVASPGAPPARAGEELVPAEAPLSKRSKAIAAIDQKVRDALEAEFTQRSDDGLLEHLDRLGSAKGADTRHKAMGTLAAAVLNRQLFKLVGTASGPADMALAQEKYKKFGTADQRRKLETAAAHRAELSRGWKVVIWLPNPTMRLKVAEVLVDNEEGVAPLDRVSDSGGQIVTQHRNLWSISVYADSPLRDDLRMRNTVDVLLSSIRTDMDVRLIRWDGTPVKTLTDLSVDKIAEVKRLEPQQREQLLELVPAALGGGQTFREMINAHWRVAHEQGFFDEATPPDSLWPASPAF